MRWQEANPGRLQRELAAMRQAAPELEWDPDLSRFGRDDGGGWRGPLPPWPFDRPAPPQLEEFLDGSCFEVQVVCLQAHPAVCPRVYPLHPDPPVKRRTVHRWHLAGDGSLCLFQRAYDWDGSETTAALVPKAAGWFLEYLLVSRGYLDGMTEAGIATDASLDPLITAEHVEPEG